jgi:hypothetical protein
VIKNWIGHSTYAGANDLDAIDYAALESLTEFQEAVGGATVIFAVDTNGENGTIVFGRELFRAIAAEVIPPQECAFVAFAVDFDTIQMEHLLAAVQVAKGFHECSMV